MTTDIEKQFFDTFGIEPIGCKDNKNCTGTLDCRTQCPNAIYPQITDRILLELICILNGHTGIDVRAEEIGALKEELLEHCIDLITYELCCIDEIDEVKQQVQSLFKEG